MGSGLCRALLLSCVLLCSTLARAAPVRVLIDARIDTELQTVRGYLHLESSTRVHLVDPLASLPMPDDDVFGPRTFPGAPEQGAVRFERIDEHSWWFYALLPRRYGDVGITAHGLFANGSWYPQPLVGGQPPTDVEWVVNLRGPADSTLVLGDRIGRGAARWQGRGERVSIAALRRAEITPIIEGGVRLQLVTRGRPRPALVRQLRSSLPQSHDWPGVLSGPVVEAPLRRRLVRPGRGMVYLSDRAFRVTPGLYRVHRVSVVRGVHAGLSTRVDPWVRSLIAGAVAQRYARRLEGLDASELARWAAWLPRIDTLLHSGRMPFVTEVFEQVFPGDPIRDDLMERYAPSVPGAVSMAQIADGWGEEAAEALGLALHEGLPPREAAELAGLPPDFLLAHRRPYPQQQLNLKLGPEPGTVGVGRSAPSQAPPEVVVVEIDAQRRPWITEEGTDATVMITEDPQRVRVDPEGHVQPTDRLGLSWPPRYILTAAAWVDTLNLSDLFVEATGALWIRRRHDTHNQVAATVFTDQQNLIGASVGYIRREGPLLDGLSRPHRISAWIRPALLSSSYAPVVEGGRTAVGAGMGYAWDTRVSRIFPVRGHRLAASAEAGVVPTTNHTWALAELSATGVLSPHPRHALVSRVDLGLAQGEVEHRLLPLGGPDGLRSISTTAALGSHRGLLQSEYRVAPIRGASVPALLAWGSSLQLSVGGELGLLHTENGPIRAAGLSTGLGVVGEVFGMEPQLMGLTLGWPLAVDGGDLEPSPGSPQVYVRWWQSF